MTGQGKSLEVLANVNSSETRDGFIVLKGNRMADYDMSIHSNPDAKAWADFFREQNPDCNVPDDVMLGWFANAMMAMHDHLHGGQPINGDHAQFILDQFKTGKDLQ